MNITKCRERVFTLLVAEGHVWYLVGHYSTPINDYQSISKWLANLETKTAVWTCQSALTLRSFHAEALEMAHSDRLGSDNGTISSSSKSHRFPFRLSSPRLLPSTPILTPARDLCRTFPIYSSRGLAVDTQDWFQCLRLADCCARFSMN